ncbi:hypothetical protein H6G54_11220 [Anabaena cylindrica FACHB-243]|uniref:Uncharacterized protein n=1 Tax=Anabaena cylindrica (strain ATCC 27899 / PCC 7122) TaxID=272123 RepID=K9ZP08_ANACC|nr:MULTISPECIES: hypothetical protein [Anabaena]AFZ60978.1 hypothetical protein Anacy_5672 [Anabaena cylindrica PCC 7122]MBD2418262.1 hypothetical protein [Anabaena cylindrica FACHB-243]MCM2409378.1 hypothetical protein [Anabaena sp. CCAP 1446/1C]BAY06424.1 hypothetical protein NIES19_57070 [Anabaena cylindrica PCC 7122]
MADLSGAWLGTYWQQGTPTRFEATFIQSGNTLAGNILDNSYLGEACLNGEVIGRRVQFTKQYLLHKQMPVNYQGTISGDDDFIQGIWDLGNFGSGNWEAHRSGENLNLELKNRLENRVPVSVK